MSEEISLAGFLTKEKPCRALIHLLHTDETYSMEVSQGIDTTYAHTVKIIKDLESRGMVRSKESGRKKMLQLTREGEKVAKALADFHGVIEEVVRPEKEGILE